MRKDQRLKNKNILTVHDSISLDMTCILLNQLLNWITETVKSKYMNVLI